MRSVGLLDYQFKVHMNALAEYREQQATTTSLLTVLIHSISILSLWLPLLTID